jgi:hypothetical protein
MCVLAIPGDPGEHVTGIHIVARAQRSALTHRLARLNRRHVASARLSRSTVFRTNSRPPLILYLTTLSQPNFRNGLWGEATGALLFIGRMTCRRTGICRTHRPELQLPWSWAQLVSILRPHDKGVFVRQHKSPPRPVQIDGRCSRASLGRSSSTSRRAASFGSASSEFSTLARRYTFCVSHPSGLRLAAWRPSMCLRTGHGRQPRQVTC